MWKTKLFPAISLGSGLVVSRVWGGGGSRKMANGDVLPDLNRKCLRAVNLLSQDNREG